MKYLISVFPLLLIFTLTGCGGGGSSSGVEPDPFPIPVPDPHPQFNTAPTISGSPKANIRAGDIFSFTPTAFDADGDILSYEIINPPYWAFFDEDTGELWGDPETADAGGYVDISIIVSDGTRTAELPLFALTVLPAQLTRDSFNTVGEVSPTSDGYQSVGTLEITSGQRTQTFEDADLLLEFDDAGLLIDLSGETMLPANPTENITIDSPVRAVVGMMTGAQINADNDIDIHLQDDTNYFVFYIGASVDMTIEDRENPGLFDSITLETPFSGKILLITDPTDPFLYTFASQPLIGEFGSGNSKNGLIPFVPALDSENLDSFNGHRIEKGSFGLGIRIFDFFKISGTRVSKLPQSGDIDWNDPFNSSIEYRAGINGDADFDFSVLSVGLFSFDLAEMSATLDVGFDRQSLAMQTRVGSDNSWVPGWFHFVPMAETEGHWFVNGNGDYAIELKGNFASTIPQAEVAGVMSIENGAVTLAGRTVNDGETLEVSISFADNKTVGRIKFPESYADDIKNGVTESMDRELVKVDNAIEDLKDKTADYEFELSLRGLRSKIPGIVNSVITELNKIPTSVGDLAYDKAWEVMNGIKKETWLGTAWLKDVPFIDLDSYAIEARDDAEGIAQIAIDNIKPKLKNLKELAAKGDDDDFREALKQALLYAYSNRKFSKKITVDVSIPGFGTKRFYDKTHTVTAINAATAKKIKLAADNIDQIPLTSKLKISAQQVLDALPTEEVIQKVKQEVNDNIAIVPSPEGLGYRAINDTYTAFVTIDGVDHPIEINVLSPSDVHTGVSDLLRKLLLGGIN